MTEVPAPFGKYYLTEKLAAGGMAELYLGKLVGPGGFEKLLVIKQIHSRLSGQRHFVDLFVAEAKILVGLVHGNIVPVYELGVIGETYFIAMEYIDGPTLFRLTEELRRHGEVMAPQLAAHVAAKVLEGLDYAHRKGEGIIHRDLSGRNVMLSRDGEVKIVDFGIAVTLGTDGDALGEQPAGSFPYMSPEQVRREPLTGQSDLFSVGILLWEMLTGERLFVRADAEETLRAVTDAEIPRPSALNAAVPARLQDAVMRALERDRAARWGSAAEMLAELHRYLYSQEHSPGPRELSALVARRCPPTARRRLTESGSDRAPASGDAPPSGPSTAVMDRATSRARRDTERSGAPRQQSFATHVELAGLLSEATTAVAAPADGDGPSEVSAPERTRAARSDTGGDARASGGAADRAPATAGADHTAAADRALDGPDAAGRARAAERGDDAPRGATGRRLVGVALAAALLGALGLTLARVAGGGAARSAGDAPASVGAESAGAPDAARDLGLADGPPALRDASADDAEREDARLDAGGGRADARRADARRAPVAPADAGEPRPPRDARPKAADAPPRTEPAFIKVGANPWGEILLDGVPAGRTPQTLTVSAGRHEVEVTFPVSDPPQRETYRLQLGAGETRAVLADFTR
ncbi:MAG: protein kinase [Kofleriaceae bacterium]